MQFAKTFIEEVLSRADIVDIVKRSIVLKKAGNSYIAPCPFHDEKTPSFHVNSQKQFYYCFGCKATGNAISFLTEYEKLSFVEAVTLLAKQSGMELPKTNTYVNSFDYFALNQKVSKFYQKQLSNSDTAINYLKQRGLTGVIAKQFAIGYGTSTWKSLYTYLKKSYQLKDLIKAGVVNEKNGRVYDKFAKRVIFPIWDHKDNIVGFGGRSIDELIPKYLNSPETDIFKKSFILYGLNHVLKNNNHGAILVVEGFMDVIKLHQHGFSNTVAALGTSLTANHIALLARFTKLISFCFDGDEAGFKAAQKALKLTANFISPELQFKFIILPKDDPDTILTKHGTEKFKQILATAKSWDEFFFTLLDKQYDLTNNLGKAEYIKAANIQINSLKDEVLRHVMLEALAKKTGYVTGESAKKDAKKVKPLSSESSSIGKLTAYLVYNPDKLAQLSKELTEKLNLISHKLLQAVIAELTKGTNTAQILQNLPNLQQVLAQITPKEVESFNLELLIEKAYKEYIRHCILKLKTKYKDGNMPKEMQNQLIELIKVSKKL